MRQPDAVRRTARWLVTLALLVASTAAAGRAQSPADSAWLAGETDRAADLYVARLEADPADEVALHRLALARAWDARYDESLDLFGQLLRISPDNPEARVDRAKVMAWSGDLEGAIREVDRVLESHPSYVPALMARARYEAWRGDLSSAISMQNELLGVAPRDRDVWRSQATYLVWDDRLVEAAAIYDSLLREDPADRDSRLGLASTLARMNQLDSAATIYAGMIEADPSDIDAWMGYARAAAWDGRLVEAEARWRRARALDPDNTSALTGLGQTLRWQGRHAASHAELKRALDIAPGDRQAVDEMRALEFDLAPRGQPGLLFTSDSDTNDIFSVEADADWHPTAAVGVRASAYLREARFGVGSLDRSAAGVLLGASTTLEPGWGLFGAVGVSGSNGSAGTTPRLEARVTSPQRHRVIGSLSFAAGPLDESALLIENGVSIDQFQAGVRARLGPLWRLHGSASLAWFDGSETNRRLAGSVFVGRTLSSVWSVGLFSRAFGFEKQLGDGYFDPDLFWLTEASATWSSGVGNWRFSLDAAPGIQFVGTGGSAQATIRAGSRVAYSLGPGRDLSLGVLYSTTGLASFSTGTGDYRFLSVGLQLDWALY